VSSGEGGVASCAALLLVALVWAAPAAGSRAGQPPGRAGCVDTQGTDGCGAAPSLAGLEPSQIVVSPNGRFVYGWQQELLFSPGAPHARLLVFARNPRSGALRPLRGRRGCLENTTRPVARQRGPCESVGGLEQPVSLVIGPDGRRLYASARGGRQGGDYLVTFAVDPRHGTLRPLQCLTDEVHSHCPFAPIASDGHLLVSPDSRFLYAGDGLRGAIDVYRVAASGVVLEQCLAGAPPLGQGCTLEPRLPAGGVGGLAEAPVGSELYAGGPVGNGAERILGFVRDAHSGSLTPSSGSAGCVSDEPVPPAGCVLVALTGSELSMSPSGEELFAASQSGYAGSSLAVAALRRDPASGALSEPAGPAGCVVFATAPARGCGTAPRWRADYPYTLAAASGGLLASAVEGRDDAGTVVAITPSPTGSALAVGDVRECGAGACRRLRGAAGELIGAIAVSPDARSLYVADGDGIAQLRMPR
jgi:hypothetical protein